MKTYALLAPIIFLWTLTSCNRIFQESKSIDPSNLPAFLETVVGNPLVDSYKFLDVDKNNKIEFTEAYVQTIKAAKAIDDQEFSEELSLIDYDNDHKISIYEVLELKKDMAEIFRLQDGDYLCSNQESIDEFSALTSNFYYFDNLWVGKIIEKKKEFPCLGTSFNLLLFRAIEAMDRNRDGYLSDDEFVALYGNALNFEQFKKFFSQMDSSINSDTYFNFMHEITYPEVSRNNMWLYDYTGILKKTIEVNNFNQYSGLYGLTYDSVRFGDQIDDILEMIKATPVEDLSDLSPGIFSHFSRSFTFFLFYMNTTKNFIKQDQIYLDIYEYDVSEHPELARFDLNQDKTYNFIDKLVIDFVAQVAYLNKKNVCTYSVWGRPFMPIDQICAKEQLSETKFKINIKELFIKDIVNDAKKDTIKLTYQMMAYGRFPLYLELLTNRTKYLENLSESFLNKIIQSDLKFDEFYSQGLYNMNQYARDRLTKEFTSSKDVVFDIETAWLKYFPDDLDEYYSHQDKVHRKIIENEYYIQSITNNYFSNDQFLEFMKTRNLRD